MSLTSTELKTKTWSEMISLYSNLTEFKLTSGIRGLIINVEPMDEDDDTNGTIVSSITGKKIKGNILIILRNTTDTSVVNLHTPDSFITGGFKNYLSFLHETEGFSNFKILPDGTFRNYDEKETLDFDTLCKGLQRIKTWKNLTHVVIVNNIIPFNSLYRVSHANARCLEEDDTISFSTKANCAYNAYYLGYDRITDECGFYCQDGSFICTLKEYASKFIFENYIHLGTIDLYLGPDSFTVKRNIAHRVKQTFKIAYTKEGYLTLFDILDNFNKIEALTDNFISICRTSTALIK